MPSDRIPHAYPQFTSVEDERRHRKQRLAAAFRLFGHFGFDEGVAGHITARDPELLDHFWVNPFGMNFKQIRVKDLILVSDHGEVVEGNWPVNTAAFVIHSQVHAARPDVVSAAHSHSVYGKAWSALRRPLDPLTQDSCAFYGDHVVFDDYTGVVLDLEEGKRIAHALGDNKAVILSNHGLLTVGHSVDDHIGGRLRHRTDGRRILRCGQHTAHSVLVASGPATWDPKALKRGGRVDVNDPAATTIDNYYLVVLAELGGLGFLAFLAVLLGGFAVAIRGLRRARAPADRSLLAALLAANVSWLFLTFVFDIFGFGGPVKLYLVLLAATMVASGATRAKARPAQAVAAHRGSA